MKIIQTATVTPDDLDAQEKDWVYNGLDACVTAEVLDVLLPQLDNTTGATYAFSRSLQAPVLEMRLRGIRIDKGRKDYVIDQYAERIDQLERQLERIVAEGCGFFGFNWRSPKDLIELFYEILGIPAIRKRGRPTVDRTALERLDAYFIARPIVSHIIAMRDLAKKVSVLKTEIDRDGRIRTSYNIAGTETGRFSSSFSEFGTGSNLQNIEELLRSVFISDRGYKMAYIDAQQIQSRIVGAIEWNLFGDGRYLDACESGDLHTAVAKICWPHLPWTGQLAHDQELAEQPYYRHYSRRSMCKKLGHGTNFDGKPPHMAQQTRMDVETVTDFRQKYFIAFPGHLRWHEWTRREIYETGVITSLTGRRRQFWGRRDSDDTVRQALAYSPQADEAYIVNSGMLQVWRNLPSVQLLMQGHDAIVVQYPEEEEDEIIPKILEQLKHPIDIGRGRSLLVPYDCQVGYNWGKVSKDNPDGLKAYQSNDQRKRQEEVGVLDRKFRRTY